MKGNAAIIKCSIPSFVADFVSVIGWTDEEGKEYINGPQKDGEHFNKFNSSSIPNKFTN